MNGSLLRVQEVPRDMPWGVMAETGPYAGMRIGEIWFDAGPLLLKFLATAEKLSVQVHPRDCHCDTSLDRPTDDQRPRFHDPARDRWDGRRRSEPHRAHDRD